MRRLAALALVLAATGTAPAARAETPPSCPYTAGLLSGAFVDEGGTRASMAIWVPSERPERPVRRGAASFYAAPDTRLPRGRRFGVVLLSHGAGGSEVDLYGLGLHLARCGWVVAAPQHPGSHARDLSQAGTAQAWRLRPRQLVRALDALQADPRLAGHLDLERVAAVGVAAGGVAALQLAGATARPARLAAHCAALPDEGLCRLLPPETLAAAPESAQTAPADDRRIGAVVALAPVGAVFAEGDLDAVRVPVLVYRAAADRVLAAPHHATRIARLMNGRAELRVAPEAGHFAFLSSMPPDLAETAGPLAADGEGFDRAGFLARLDAEVAAFLWRALPAEGPAQETGANSSLR